MTELHGAAWRTPSVITRYRLSVLSVGVKREQTYVEA
jgi:hypothetical protein